MPKAVIMAGGQGERFWPLTHKNFPKYRIRLNSQTSLLQGTFKRLLSIYRAADIFVVTTEEHKRFIRAELPKLPKKNIFIEPFRKNTAPAILLSCSWVHKYFGEDEIVSFFPADHLIRKEDLFKKTLKEAIGLARAKDVLVTIGIKPNFPATGYGYIEAGSPVSGHRGLFFVKRFHEKPDRQTAARYIQKSNFLWNGGIFTWKTGVFLETLKRFSPNLVRTLNLANLKSSYHKLPSISIDYALLEKADNITVAQTRMDWCDMGSWDMFLEKARMDASGNFLMGRAVQKECRNSLVLNTSQKPFVALGLDKMIAVQTDFGALVCCRTRSEEAALLAKNLVT